MKPFRAYILRCADSSYYVGHTDDLDKRIVERQAGNGGYTSSRLPIELAWSQEFANRDESIQAEQQLKGWSRKKKEAMMRNEWKEVQRIAWGRKNALPDHLK